MKAVDRFLERRKQRDLCFRLMLAVNKVIDKINAGKCPAKDLAELREAIEHAERAAR